MGINEPSREIHFHDITNEGGNIAFGDYNRQNIINESQPANEVRRLVEQIRSELAWVADLPSRTEADEALTEIIEVLYDGAVPSRPQRLDRARRRLMSALEGVTRFVAPLAELTLAIAELLRSKP